MANKVKHTATTSAPSFADAIAIREKADKLLADAEKAMADFQAKAWEVLKAKGAVTEGTYKDNKTGEVLGTGPVATGNGVYNGQEFSFFSRWNRSEGKPTLVFKGLFAGADKAEKTLIQF